MCGPHLKDLIIDQVLPMMTTTFVQGDIWGMNVIRFWSTMGLPYAMSQGQFCHGVT